MSLEDAIYKLAAATERDYSGSAVAEIIRQRDEALNNRSAAIRSMEWERERKQSLSAALDAERRRTIALRGVITRMKRKANQ